MHYKLLLSISLLFAHQSRQGGPDVFCWVSVLLPSLLVLRVAALMEWVKLPVLWTRSCSCDVCGIWCSGWNVYLFKKNKRTSMCVSSGLLALFLFLPISQLLFINILMQEESCENVQSLIQSRLMQNPRLPLCLEGCCQVHADFVLLTQNTLHKYLFLIFIYLFLIHGNFYSVCVTASIQDQDLKFCVFTVIIIRTVTQF